MSVDEAPEPDRAPGAPHPREAARILGQESAVSALLTSARADRLHHAWLLTGPRGTGKATLAWAMAKWLLSDGTADSLHTDPEAPVVRRIRAMSEPRLLLVRRPVDEKTGRVKAEITVDEVRRLQGFFHMSAAEGGRRVAIVDAADEMNTAAANALLKQLEEPPRDAVLILVAHQPGKLLPTIRSRCRELRLNPLGGEDMRTVLDELGVSGNHERLAALSGGSVGEAVRLANQDGLERYQKIVDLFADFPRVDRRAISALAEAAAARASAEGDPFDLIVTLLDRFLNRAARTGLLGAPFPEAAAREAEVLSRISPDQHAAMLWAGAQAQTSARARAGRAVNLDPSALVMDMLIELVNQPAI
ncbi:DNA polymerase III subunit delta' [Paracoccus sp. MBLB3053]|uniref:DNA polymerase III subunit delta n=1 Tax=Paracoccus aurantius TaxID=3073814 RepID=A0ABU2HRA0_9RHOB|nr:DNA polymerase III subunit delta' [Paracoccus sp. MBLB3053]MDS9467297.1 DNA polymerase III subunit delta' [Paracoccus sp. MBLB3053]